MCKSPYIYIYNSSLPQTHFSLVYTTLIKFISPVAFHVWESSLHVNFARKNRQYKWEYPSNIWKHTVCLQKYWNILSKTGRLCLVTFFRHNEIVGFIIQNSSYNSSKMINAFKCKTTTASWNTVLSAFAKLRKVTVTFVMSVCPSRRPHSTSRLPMDGFS